ncbi:MAG: hypothetical protein M1828_000777 [Chrysothrix sp. TS-e1954]|nr:MAG: hypothetical protein M1828_000777 [Chrysothrix sp. TS-e1954]
MSTIPLALYLWRRIRQVGIQSIMGVPGDFNLNFLDYIYDVEGLKWVGNANELNSAYAADGYGRVRGVPGCLVTTHGVGELSAINGIAGAMSEHVPLIHIVGQTAKPMQDHHMQIHHSIGAQPDHQVYAKMAKPVRCAEAYLWDPAKAPGMIDNAIRECFLQKLPVYILFPIDLTEAPVEESLLDQHIDLSLTSVVNKKVEDEAVRSTLAEIYKSKNPSILVDHLVHSHGREEAKQLVRELELPVYSAHMGKSFVDETSPFFVGVYNADLSAPGVADAFEASDLCLALGWWASDSNTVGFARKMPVDRRIDVLERSVIIKGTAYNGVLMGPFLERLTKELDKSSAPKVNIPKAGKISQAEDHASKDITQSYIWTRIGELLRPGDVVLADTGTAAFGFPDASFPENVTYICQTYYGSIGYCTPAALGVDMALREKHQLDPSKPRGRTVLVTGDGSIQLTVQEVGTMIARGLQPMIIVINNDGYTIERAIHGARQKYNDIAPYRWDHLLPFFSHPNPGEAYHLAKTREDFEAVWKKDSFINPKETQLLEVRMDKLDSPWRLTGLLAKRPGMKEYFEKEGFTNIPK